MGELRCTFCGSLFPCGCRPRLYRHCENYDKQAAEIERLRERGKHTVAIGELESWKLSQAGLQKENDQFREENKRLTAELKTMTAMWSSLRHKLDEVREENKQSREALQEVHVRLQRLWEMTPASGTLLKLIRTMGDCIGAALKQTDPGNSAGQHRR